MTKQKTPQQEFIEDPATGRRWPLVVETFTNTTVDGHTIAVDRIRGFWVGEPHRSSFIAIDSVADKRGITDGLKLRVRAEAKALTALREAYKHPLPPSPRASKRAEQPPVPEWGTLEWYRNGLAAAQDRIRLLESERDTLLAEKRERDPVVQYVIEQPSKSGSLPRNRPSPYEKEFAKWRDAAAMKLSQDPNANNKVLAEAIREKTQTKAADPRLCKWVKDHRADRDGKEGIETRAAKLRHARQLVKAAKHSGM